MDHPAWPHLTLDAWEPTYLTLHRWMQIVGKVRLAHARWLNHWWHVPLYVTSHGLTTSSMPCGERQVTMTFDFCAHQLVAHASDKRTEAIALEPMSVARFYERVRGLLSKLGVEARIWPVPVEVVDRTPFPEDERHCAYDPAAVERLHRALLSIDGVFQRHRGQFLGKSSPVHLFWGAFDLAVTRFSGRENPSAPTDSVMGEAYSHEVISHGFWPGGDWPIGGRVDEPVFYAYAVPQPAGFRDAPVRPNAATFSEKLGEFILPYEAVRTADDPEAVLLDFMEDTYLAAAKPAGWDIERLRHPGAAPQRATISPG
jgi:hypothetical protein